MDGSMDNELDVVLEEQPEDWNLRGLSSFTNILRRCEARKAVEARKLQSQLAAKAAAANMDMLLADLEADEGDVKAYMAAVESAKKVHDRRVCQYKRNRYENGCYQVKEFMKKRFSIVDIPGVMHISREVGDMRRILEQEVPPKGEGSALVMLYLDLNIDHSPSAISALVESMKLLHQTPSFCVCVRWLVRHANNTPENVTAVNRKVEDALQKADVWLSDTQSTLLFDKESLHKSDNRPLAARFSVGVSKQFGAGSLWMNTAAARGHLGMATLIRPCHMCQPASKDRGCMDVKLTPRDRAVQLGKEAHVALLSGLLLQALEQPGDAGGPPSHSRKALIVQLVPGEFESWATPPWANGWRWRRLVAPSVP